MVSIIYYLFRKWDLSEVPLGYRRKPDPLLVNVCLVADIAILILFIR